jgi:hypothetical protein
MIDVLVLCIRQFTSEKGVFEFEGFRPITKLKKTNPIFQMKNFSISPCF